MEVVSMAEDGGKETKGAGRRIIAGMFYHFLVPVRGIYLFSDLDYFPEQSERVFNEVGVRTARKPGGLKMGRH